MRDDTLTTIELTGVPFDGFGRRGHQARAAAVLREAGLATAFAGHEVVIGPDLDLPEQTGERGAASGLMNESALVAMAGALNARVGAALAEGRFPVVYGGDCTVLLGAVPALRDAAGAAGLVFVDGHEDATPLDLSDTGEGANSEVALLLGLIRGQFVPEGLRERLPALGFEALAVLGPRDRGLRHALNVGTLADHGVWLRRHDEVAADPGGLARAAAAHVTGAALHGWWLHIDLDVLAQDEFTAQLVPGDTDEEGGLTWAQLTALVASALAAGGCRGWSLAIYDPEQDADGREARRIVRFVSDVAPFLR